MRYSNVEFSVVYVDPSKSTSGDGTMPTTAKNALPTSASDYVDGTCFIIRRTAETAACVLPSGTCYDVKNIIFMGMPTSSDAMWELVPTAAKTAWGNDSAQYANIQMTANNGSFQLPAINHFLLHRVYLFRDNLSADSYLLRFYNSSEMIGCYAFEHCKFGSRGINLDNSAYIGALTQSRCKAYVYIYYARMVDISDCVINHAVTGSSSNGHGIYINWSDVINVQDVKIFAAAWTSSSQNYPLYLASNYNKGVECNIVNVTETVRMNGSASYVPTLFYVQGYIALNIKNIKVEMGTPLSSSQPSSFSIESPIMHLGSVYEMSVDSINVALPRCWDCRGAVINMSRCYESTYVPGIGKAIKNIAVQLGDTSGIGSNTSYSNATQSGANYAAVVMDFSSGDGNVHAKVPCVDNLIVKNYRGKAFYGECIRLTDATFEGTVMLSKSIADITSVKTWFPGKAVHVYDGTHARVRKLICNINNPDYPYNEDPAVGTTPSSDTADVFVDESNTALSPMVASSSRTNHPYLGIGCNNEGAEGHFAYRCINGLCDTWSVHRQGGGASALKIYNNACSGADMMVLGRRPFNGMELLPITTGRHILKVYIAFKGYAKPTELYRHFFLSAQVGGKTYYSTLHGSWEDDTTSVWVNDSDLTQMVLKMPIDISEVGPVNVRVYFSWYASAGFVYLDPDIKLEGV